MPKWEKFISAGFRMPFYMNLFVEGHVDAVTQVTGWRHPRSLVVIERQMNTVYESPEVIKDYRVFVTPRLRDADWRRRFIEAFRIADGNLLKFCRSLYYRDYETSSLAEFGQDLRQFTGLFRFKFGIYGLPKFTDLAINEVLPELIIAPLTDGDLAVLTKPTIQSEYTKERINFLRLAQEIKELGLANLFNESQAEALDRLGRFHPELYYKIESHVREFAWINVSHLVQPLTLDQMFVNLRAGLADETAAKELAERETETERMLPEQKEGQAKLGLTSADTEVLDFIKSLNEINESRKAAMSQALLYSYPMFQALADRLAVDVISLRQLTAGELAAVVASGRLSEADRQTMRQRLEYYTCLLENGVVTNLSGEEAKALAERELGITDYSAITELRGRTAQPGRVKGKVRLILTEHQVEQLQPGEILVTSMTDPDMVTAMKRAAAIVTDEGGITCHAAIVSRELGVPCIIGTKIATKVFQSGDLVEVDAGQGVVRKNF